MDNVEKEYVQILVERVKLYKRVYKYLTYDSGLKMLQYNNLQFTRANKLNDEHDCHIDKVNFDFVMNTAKDINIDADELVSEVVNKHKESISSFGICSLGTSSDTDKLWDGYTKTNNNYDGICIEIDIEAAIKCLYKQNIKAMAFVVDYIDSVIESIPYQYFIGEKWQQFIFLTKLFATKDTAVWEEEKELRIVLPQKLSIDEEYYRVKLYKSCFKNVYLGKDVTEKQYNTINSVIEKSKYKLKIIRYDQTAKTI